MKYIKSMAQQKLCFLLALYIGLFMNGAVFFRRFDGYAHDFTVWKGIAAVVELVAAVLVTFFLFRILTLFGRRVWRVLATFIVLCSAAASYYMTFMNVVIGYGIVASVMTTDIDLSKEVVGLHFILWLVAVSALPLLLIWSNRCRYTLVHQIRTPGKRFRSVAVVLLAGLTVKVGRMLRVKNRFWYFLIGFSWCATFPFVRMSAVLGQPDWFGLIFAFMLMLLTLDYRFDGIDLPRYLLIFAATAGIILTRRWYLYFVVGYCFAYVLMLAVSSIRLAKDGQPSRAVHRMVRLVAFGLCAAGAMVLLLLPMVRKILSFDYAGRYSYYNFGGITLELAAQTLRIGLLNFILIGIGLWFAAKRRLPALPCLAGTELLVSLVLFTRVQNTGSHQMLLFVPGWLLLFLVGSAALADGLKKHTAVKLCYWGFTMVFAVSVRCSPLTTVALPGFVVDHFPLKAVSEFVRLDKLTYDRTDAAQIQRVDDWIDAHCDAEKGEFAYMIPHDMLYNPDHFKNCRLPETPINDKLAFGFSVPGTHNFPTQFFEAKYVITCEPFPQTYVGSGEMSIKLNDQFLAVRDQYFAFEQSFDMGNGTTFTIWKRTAAPTREEVEYYLSAFPEENAQYPEMFSQVAEAWLTAHGL